MFGEGAFAKGRDLGPSPAVTNGAQEGTGVAAEIGGSKGEEVEGTPLIKKGQGRFTTRRRFVLTLIRGGWGAL